MATSYDTWAKLYHPLSMMDKQMIRQHLSELPYHPKISIVMPVYNTKEIWLKKAIESVLTQLYDNWELCICDNGSKSYINTILNSYQDDRIKRIRVEDNVGGAEGTNKAINISTGEYIAFLDSDDELVEDSLYYIVVALNENRNLKFIYSDNSFIDGAGDIFSTFYKPDWSPDLIYSECFPADFAVFEGSLTRTLMLRDSSGSHDYDLLLRAIEIITPEEIYHVQEIIYKYRVHTESLTSHDESRSVLGAIKSLREHLQRRGIKAKVMMDWPWYRVKYELPDPMPSVAILIASINKQNLLINCLDKIFARTDYSSFKVYICAPEKAKQEYLVRHKQLETKGMVQFVPRDDNEEFNFSRLLNRMVAASSEPILCILNDDIEAIQDDWLSELVSHAVRPRVGMVGAKLLYPNFTTQHAGVILGIGGPAAHVHKNQSFSTLGYWGRASLIGNYSAVTGACSVIQRDRYLEVGGFDENLRVAYNDVDCCLKLLKKGYFNVYTPYSVLIHAESATRGLDTTPEQQSLLIHETNWMNNKWGYLIQHDPYYNPHLSLENTSFEITTKPRNIKPWLK